jgi:hypothetical protein
VQEIIKAVSNRGPVKQFRIVAITKKDDKIGITPWYTEAVIDMVKEDVIRRGDEIVEIETRTI